MTADRLPSVAGGAILGAVAACMLVVIIGVMADRSTDLGIAVLVIFSTPSILHLGFGLLAIAGATVGGRAGWLVMHPAASLDTKANARAFLTVCGVFVGFTAVWLWISLSDRLK